MISALCNFIYDLVDLLFQTLLAILKLPLFLVRSIFRRHKTSYMRKTYYDLQDLIHTFEEHPTEFEFYVAKIYEKYGYNVQVTKATNDRGKDLEMWFDDEKYVVEVKLYQTYRRVSRDKIQKLHSAMIDSDAEHAIFVTTSDYSKNSVEYAEKHGIQLIDGIELIDLING